MPRKKTQNKLDRNDPRRISFFNTEKSKSLKRGGSKRKASNKEEEGVKFVKRKAQSGLKYKILSQNSGNKRKANASSKTAKKRKLNAVPVPQYPATSFTPTAQKSSGLSLKQSTAKDSQNTLSPDEFVNQLIKQELSYLQPVYNDRFQYIMDSFTASANLSLSSIRNHSFLPTQVKSRPRVLSNPKNQQMRDELQRWKQSAARIDAEIKKWEEIRSKYTNLPARYAIDPNEAASHLTDQDQHFLEDNHSGRVTSAISNTHNVLSTQLDVLMSGIREISHNISVVKELEEQISTRAHKQAFQEFENIHDAKKIISAIQGS